MSASDLPPATFWPQLALLVFGGLALGYGVSFMSARLGWRQFAQKYSATTRPAGRVYWVPVADFGLLVSFLVVYRNTVHIVFAEQGIYFSREFPLGLFHRPFLVPWERVWRVEKKDSFLMGRRFLLDVKDDAVGQIRMCLPGKVERELQRYFPPMHGMNAGAVAA